MRKIGDSSALRAILLAWALSLTCLPTNLMAAPSDSVQTVDQAGPSDEPFGLSTETVRSEEHTSLQSRLHLVCRLLLEKKKNQSSTPAAPSSPAPSDARVCAGMTAALTGHTSHGEAQKTACKPDAAGVPRPSVISAPLWE